ncbi:MAG TPA: hypothetical protein VFA21_20395 [Pyrinomonadaceae bacterium]|nr:hypothetical protein [Pyrinomonadaceae bacterium]
MNGLKGSRARAEAQRLAETHGCSVSRVYDVTRELRPRRKVRADRGRRRADLLAHEGMRLAAELVVTKNVDPDLAIETAELNGHDIPVSRGTFVRQLREHGLDRRSRRRGVRPYRRWEASAPGDIFQFDISGVKERWVDHRTRRILHVSPLEVSKNHPNKNPDRVPLWKFTLVDDNSRLKHVRFVACNKPTSNEVIDFLLDAFRALGVPRRLYTDNDAVIVSRRMKRAADILDRAFADSGGFKLEQHLPGNPQATGKVEVGHQLVEKFEKLIGVRDADPTLDQLEKFCEWLCDRYNWTVNRATGEKPMLRWQSQNTLVRVPPPALLDSAFKADEFTRKLGADLSISFRGERLQLPRKRPFTDWIGRALTFVMPPDSDFFVVLGLDGFEYEITRTPATADAADQFKQPEESTAQQTKKALVASAKERRARQKEAGEGLLVPGFDTEIDATGRPSLMPKKRDELSPERLAEAVPGVVPPSHGGRRLTYFEAVKHFQGKEGGELLPKPLDRITQKWLKTLFGHNEFLLDTELREEIALHNSRVEDAQTAIAGMRRA